MLIIHRKNYWTWLFLFCLGSFAIGCAPQKEQKHPKAKVGFLDLSKSSLSTPIPLDGEWFFLWNKLQTPKNPKTKWDTKSLIHVPSSWRKGLGRKKALPAQGIATYRLRIKLPKDRPEWLMLKAGRVSSSYELWINGKKALKSGTVGRAENSSEMDLRHRRVHLPTRTQSLELVVLVSNHRHRTAGLRQSWYIGEAHSIITEQQSRHFASGILPSIIFFTGLLFLALGGVRREGSWLWFGAFCLTTAIRAAVGNDGQALRSLAPWLDSMGHLHLEYVSIFWVAACTTGLFSSTFPKQAPKYLTKGIILFSFGMSILAAVLPLKWVLKTLPLFGVVSLATIITAFWINIKAWLASEKLAGTLLAALSIALLAFVHDYTKAMELVTSSSLELAPASFLLLIFIQTYALASRFAESFDRIKLLRDKLKDAYTQLQIDHDLVLQELEEVKELGNYRLEKLLGTGGMGAVWLANHRLLARPAAVKLILPENYSKESQGTIRFEREAKITALLRSPHTIELYDFGKSPQGEFYYAMELLDGLDLGDYITEFGTMPPERVIHILQQVCHSLAEAHGVGLVHRDVKPANIFLCRMGEQYDFIKVLDFGLVKPLDLVEETPPPQLEPPANSESDTAEVDPAEDKTLVAGKIPSATTDSQSALKASVAKSFEEELTMAGSITGTPNFMPPEQIQNEALDGRTDLYALGCIAYQLLSGRPVFENSGMFELLYHQVSTKPQPLAEVAQQSIPFRLVKLVEQCLEKNPEDRPRSALILLDALDELAKSYPWSNKDAKKWWVLHQPETIQASEERQKAATRQ